MMKPSAFAVAALLASAAHADTAMPDYRDNRSTAADVVQSYYNAVNRHEYLRAYSYFQFGTLGLFSQFEAGYADTAHVDIRLGPVTSDGTAGAVHFAVPVALQAQDSHGQISVFSGCYLLTQVEPSIQGTPPFVPIEINAGHLVKTKAAFAHAMGNCN